MARHKDVNWKLPEGVPCATGRTHEWNSIQVALLMDIRDELKHLNAVIYCPNFIAIPRKLERIARNTTKRKKGQA